MNPSPEEVNPDPGGWKTRLGVVVIGRNEGERLVKCLHSLTGRAAVLVYVDSGSTDDSVRAARDCGAEVALLDNSRPFTAARARNLGFDRLREVDSSLEWVQFVDGDCEVVTGWLDLATAFLESHQDVAMVCGRTRERYPERSVYNRLCDMEWDTPVGEAHACGGIAMARVPAFEEVGGFNSALIAGEEPELCVRLRRGGWRIWRLDAEMVLHDAAMTRFSQWWKRSKRAGFAFAEGARLHGAPPERHWVREARSARIWAAGVPAAILGGIAAFGPAAAWALLVYPLQVLRLALRRPGHRAHSLLWAFFLVLGKFPELLGQLKFFARRTRGRPATLIEYK